MLRTEAETAEYDARKADYPKATRVGVCIALFMCAIWGASQHMLVALDSVAVGKWLLLAPWRRELPYSECVQDPGEKRSLVARS